MKFISVIFSIFALSLAPYVSTFAASEVADNAFADLLQLEGKWQGTLAKTDGTSVNLQLEYSIKSNGSALLEESSEDGIQMLNIFNKQQDTVVATHYCGLMNKPVARLVSADNGVIKLETDAAESGLVEGRDDYVDSWTLSLMPEDPNQFKYEYTVMQAAGTVVSATAVVTRVQ
jgi:hypothetical protein